tara:strand:+ start:478 stop:1137 length:660 start_codon:yes stop_codon:yes gene_type:complete
MADQLNKEIIHLNKLITDIGLKVKSAVSDSMDAIRLMDKDKAMLINKKDAVIDQLEVELEEACLNILALHQPVAMDLRYIFAITKINSDLERVGDLASNIAQMVHKFKDNSKIVIPKRIFSMSSIVQNMLEISLDSLINKKTNVAKTVLIMDDEVDIIHNSMYRFIEFKSKEDYKMMGQWLCVLSVSRYLERIADHATNISEDVIYMVDGQIARHGNKI